MNGPLVKIVEPHFRARCLRCIVWRMQQKLSLITVYKRVCLYLPIRTLQCSSSSRDFGRRTVSPEVTFNLLDAAAAAQPPRGAALETPVLRFSHLLLFTRYIWSFKGFFFTQAQVCTVNALIISYSITLRKSKSGSKLDLHISTLSRLTLLVWLRPPFQLCEVTTIRDSLCLSYTHTNEVMVNKQVQFEGKLL